MTIHCPVCKADVEIYPSCASTCKACGIQLEMDSTGPVRPLLTRGDYQAIRRAREEEAKETATEQLSKAVAKEFGVEIDRFNLPAPTPSGVEIMPPEVLISGDAVANLKDVCEMAEQYIRNPANATIVSAEVRAFIRTIIEGT